MSNNTDNRIDILEGILLKLHHGADPESVQDEFNEHFTGVSAIEISMMEHQLMYGDSVITFQDVLKLCNVHANLFKGTIEDGKAPDADHPGHPVTVFKEENMALRSALLRINNILDTFEEMPVEELSDGMIKGLKRQYDIIGQFDNHYNRKEHLFFPVMESYGHDAPPKVMWAKDDEIRDLFKRAYKAMEKFPDIKFSKVRDTYEAFQFEFNEMIFKEEAILINILLESFNQLDWYNIALQSDNYGYAIIPPRETWEPENLAGLLEEDTKKAEELTIQEVPTPTKSVQKTMNTVESKTIETRKITVNGGQFTVLWEPDETLDSSSNQIMNPTVPLSIGDGYLSLEQIKVIFDYIPVKVTFVDQNDIVQYFNHKKESSILPRHAENIGAKVEDVYPEAVWDTLEPIVQAFKDNTLTEESFWFEHESEFLYISYKALFNESGQYQGFVEIIQNIQPILDIQTDKWRNLLPQSKVDLTLKDPANLTQVNHKHQSQAESQVLQFGKGQLEFNWSVSNETVVNDPKDFSNEQLISIGEGYLSLKQVRLILDSMPFEVTYVDGDHKFKYFNNIGPYDEMLFQRSPLEIGRDLEYCHPARVWPKVKRLSEDLQAQRRFIEPMWFSPGNKLIYILYIGAQDQNDNYHGIVETVQDASMYVELDGTEKRLY